MFVLVTLCPPRCRQRRLTIYKGSFMVPDASAFCVAVRLGGSLVMFVAGCTEPVGTTTARVLVAWGCSLGGVDIPKSLTCVLVWSVRLTNLSGMGSSGGSGDISHG